MSTLEVKAIQAPSGYDLQMPAGHILQVKQTILTSTVNISSPANRTYSLISGLAVSITPKSTSSKILVSINVCIDTNNNYAVGLHIYRDSTQITPAGVSVDGMTSFLAFQQPADTRDMGVLQAGSYLDSPNTTSEIVYSVYGAKPTASTAALGINTLGGTSQITVMEVAG